MKHIQKDALELFIKKNADYGDAFATFGVLVLKIRSRDVSPFPVRTCKW
jgi:hypothetical protein